MGLYPAVALDARVSLALDVVLIVDPSLQIGRVASGRRLGPALPGPLRPLDGPVVQRMPRRVPHDVKPRADETPGRPGGPLADRAPGPVVIDADPPRRRPAFEGPPQLPPGLGGGDRLPTPEWGTPRCAGVRCSPRRPPAANWPGSRRPGPSARRRRPARCRAGRGGPRRRRLGPSRRGAGPQPNAAEPTLEGPLGGRGVEAHVEQGNADPAGDPGRVGPPLLRRRGEGGVGRGRGRRGGEPGGVVGGRSPLAALAPAGE